MMETKQIIVQMERTIVELIILSDMMREYPEKAQEAKGAANIIRNWIEDIKE